MYKIKNYTLILALAVLVSSQCQGPENELRSTIDFGGDWKFYLAENNENIDNLPRDSAWLELDLPHDWSIEGEFNPDHPATPGGGALPGGIGWYRKTFLLAEENHGKKIFIDFDGIYRNSEVWINGQFLGFRPNGYISFRYDLTPHLKFGTATNEIIVRVDNSMQPNSRWYSGSGIYRNVRLVITPEVHVDHWGTFISVSEIRSDTALVSVKTSIRNSSSENRNITLLTSVFDRIGHEVAAGQLDLLIPGDTVSEIRQNLILTGINHWTLDDPYLYTALSEVSLEEKPVDAVRTPFGIRHFSFDPEKGFFLNGKPVKINGVCMHHDLGCLGSAVNKRALERQIEILKSFGCNSIRTSHNPPAPELLDLCDRMGILVMDEAFDMWKLAKSRFDYHMYWDEWAARDLADFVRRDRNHPSIICWSIGNEIREQWDSTGTNMARELASIVKSLDPTRPVTSGLNSPAPHNYIIRSGSLDLIGFNYHHEDFEDFPLNFPGQCFIAAETTSALATRGSYDMPYDSIRVWPVRWDVPFRSGNPDHTCSSYDNCHVPWGSTHEDILKLMNRHDFISGVYVWTGFDYLGEPTPYWWPSRSSYFGIVDLAGFPKDAYYLYKSRWTTEPVLHIFPHWNWQEGDTIDVVAYTNCQEAELFLNGTSFGTKTFDNDKLHLHWKVPYTAGELKAIGRTNGVTVLEKYVRTAGPPARIELTPDRDLLLAGTKDLSFVTITVTDQDGNMVPDADHLIQFSIEGPGIIAGVDNGNPVSHEPFRAESRKCFNGKCLLVLRSADRPGRLHVTASAAGLETESVVLRAVKHVR